MISFPIIETQSNSVNLLTSNMLQLEIPKEEMMISISPKIQIQQYLVYHYAIQKILIKQKSTSTIINHNF